MSSDIMCKHHLIYRVCVSDLAQMLIQRRIICIYLDKVYILQICEDQSNSGIEQIPASAWDSALYETH